MDPLTGIMGVGGGTSEYVSPEQKAKYDELLKEIEQILVKGAPFSEQDSEDLASAAEELNVMRKRGLTPSMDDFVSALFAFMAASGANPSQGNFYITPDKIEGLSNVQITIKGSTMSLAEALNAVTDPDYDRTSTQKLNDMLLRFSNWSYGIYMDQVKNMNEQVESATAILNDLGELKEFTNMAKANLPGNYKNPPDSWGDIPQGVRDEVVKAMNLSDEDFGPSGVPKDFAKVRDWIVHNPDKYADFSEAYFKPLLGVSADPQPDPYAAAGRLLDVRDDLMKQRDRLIAAGADSGLGSALDTINKVLDDLNKSLPLDLFPYDESPTGYADKFSDCVEKDANGKVIMDDQGLPVLTDKGKELAGGAGLLVRVGGAIGAYIEHANAAGNTSTSTVRDDIEKAFQASQNLSSKQTDELKAKNLFLQTFYDILTQIAEGLNKAILSIAQKH